MRLDREVRPRSLGPESHSKEFGFYTEGSRNPLESFKQKNDMIRCEGCQHIQFSSPDVYGVPATCTVLDDGQTRQRHGPCPAAAHGFC